MITSRNVNLNISCGDLIRVTIGPGRSRFTFHNPFTGRPNHKLSSSYPEEINCCTFVRTIDAKGAPVLDSNPIDMLILLPEGMFMIYFEDVVVHKL